MRHVIRRTVPHRVAGALGVLATLVALPAVAGAHDGVDHGTGIDAQLFKPALDPSGIYSLERARGPKIWDFGLRVTTSFAQEPLSLDTVTASGDDAIIERLIVLDFGISLGLSDKLTFGLNAPLHLQPLGEGYGDAGRYSAVDPNLENVARPGTGFYSTREEQNTEPSKNTPGDVRLGVKYRVLERGKLALSAQGVVWVPFGDEDVFAGSNGFTLEPKLIVELALGTKGFAALNVGARLREGVLAETRQVYASGEVDNGPVGMGGDQTTAVYFPKLYVGSEVSVGAGALYSLNPNIAVGGEVYALIPIDTADEMVCGSGCTNGDLTGDVLAGAFFNLTGDTRLAIAAGTSIVPSAARSETFRVLAGLIWTPTTEGARAAGRGDSDGDGLPDGPDVCPDEPEDEDQFQDDDGCPELDNDLDGVLDAQDRCPNEPEDRDGYQDNDGCAEGDNDNDGVPDLTDRCPSESEDPDDYQDDDGCPDDDNDGDGILDKKDGCPNEAETVNGYQDLDGCPDIGVQGGPKLVADRIDLQGDRVEFTGKTANPTKATTRVLDDVAAIMLANPTVRFRIEVAVEQSGAGKPKDKAADLRLTQQRAQTIANYLRSKGVPVQQIDASGLGSNFPLDAKNPKDATRNRRVEFIRL